MAIHRFGIPALLPAQVELLSGPGCPVCVTPTTYVDRAIEVAREKDAVLTTFGDLFRVPGGNGSLEDAAAAGLDVRVVYSPMDALKIAADNAAREVVFLAVGFETTAPGTAATVVEAESRRIRNFRVLSGHKTMPQALRALLEAPEVALDGFILPGHVSTIIGMAPYSFIAGEFGIPCSITGFEPTDILHSILELVHQCASGEARVENRYPRAVRTEGNRKAQALMCKVFGPVDAQWRGLGLIPGSGLELKDEWADFRAPGPDPAASSSEDGACRCAQVLRGLIKPTQCPLFAVRCTPEAPVGACMVSSEGSCAAWYTFSRR
jgi:hydrogenase expression/formation protein HypD